MDLVHVPNIDRIVSISHQTIDRFSTWCEELEVHFNSLSTDFPDKKIKHILKKLTDYKPSTEFPQINNMFYVLADAVLDVVESNKTLPKVPTKSVVSLMLNKIQKITSYNSSMLPIDTFDKAMVKQNTNELTQLKKLIAEHRQTYLKLQKQQRICWIANSKMTKYELCLHTAKTSRSHMADELSKKELDARDKSIEQLQKTLDLKVELAVEASRQYHALLDHEATTRKRMQMLENKVIQDLTIGLTERVNSGLSSLKQILATKTTKRSNELLEQIKSIQAGSRDIVLCFITRLSSIYNCINTQKFQDKNGFNVSLPNIQFISLEESSKHTNTAEAIDINNNQNSDNSFIQNKYLKTKIISTSQSPAIKKVEEGIIMKQKISTDSSDISFGWYKVTSYGQKKWTFFQKHNDVTSAM